jgi:multimeric flavodoxin WrbA
MAHITKRKQIFLYVAPFPALALFKVWASWGLLLPGAAAMLAYCGFILFLAHRWDRPSYLDWAATAYFALATASLIAWPEAAGPIFTDFAVTGIYLCLFCAAFVPPLLGMAPFTHHYARKYTPPAVWNHPIFLRINLLMTHAWAGLFLLCVLLSLYPSVVTRALIPLGMILGVGLPFNLRFPDYYLRRLGLPPLAEQNRALGKGASQRPETPAAISPQPQAGSGQDRTSGRAKEAVMKVLAINSSPRGDGMSKTEMMLTALVKGMRDAGAHVEVVNLRQKSVRFCIGCYTCWTKTPGLCVHKDDMSQEIFPRWLEADVAVYATPLYHYTMNAAMKAVIERTLPALQPFFERRDGRTHHPVRHSPPKVVVLSVAGFPEMSVFDQLSQYVNFIFRKGLLAEIYRPAAELLAQGPYEKQRNEMLAAVEIAGGEIVHSSAVSQETLERITFPLGDPESFAKVGDLMWKTCIREGITPKEFRERGMVPRPDSVESFMLILPMGFDPHAAGDLSATIQFIFSGEVQGTCHFLIADGRMEAKPGPSAKPDLLIESPFEVWMDIMTGRADGQQMFMQQKYTIAGDLSLLLRMQALFGKK